MAHGLSAVREQRLDAYAERFAQAGIAVLLFDYRHFGASGGEPRQLLSVGRQLRDWEAAIAAARALPGVDPSRIALFGTSFSGGHVQALAARDPGIEAVVAQVPLCDGLRSLRGVGFRHIVRSAAAGLRDVVMSSIGLGPYRIPVVGAPGSAALLVTTDAVGGYAGLTPPGSTWRNEVCARISLSIPRYRPSRAAGRIRCPILYTIAEGDLLTPARLIRSAAGRAPRAETKAYECGHFEVYVAPVWDQVVADQTEFLIRHLGVNQPRGG